MRCRRPDAPLMATGFVPLSKLLLSLELFAGLLLQRKHWWRHDVGRPGQDRLTTIRLSLSSARQSAGLPQCRRWIVQRRS